MLTNLLAALQKGKENGWGTREKRGAMGTVEQREEELSSLYNSIKKSRVQIRVAFKSDNFVSFDIENNSGVITPSFSITRFNHEILIQDGSYNILDRLTPGDGKVYNQWRKVFQDSKKVELNKMYSGEEFLDSILPSLGKVLVPGTQATERTTNKTKPGVTATEATSATKTVPTTGITSTEGASTIDSIITESSSKDTAGNTTKKPFDFEASIQSQRSTTEGMNRTTQATAKSNTSKEITTPNGDINWEHSVFNSTYEPNLSPGLIEGPGSTGTTAGVLEEATATWTVLGVVGLFIAGAIGAKMVYNYFRPNVYDFGETPKSKYDEGFKEEEPHNGGATVVNMGEEPKATEPLLSQGNQGQIAPAKPPRARQGATGSPNEPSGSLENLSKVQWSGKEVQI